MRGFCGWNLFTTAKVIGWIGVISTMAEGLANCMGRSSCEWADDFSHLMYPDLDTDYLDRINWILTQSCFDPNIQISNIIISLLVSLFLIIGTSKLNHLLLLPWLIINGIGLLVYTFVVPISTIGPITAFLHCGQDEAAASLLVWLILAAFFGIWLCIWMEIRALYFFIKNDETSKTSGFSKTTTNKCDRLKDPICQEV